MEKSKDVVKQIKNATRRKFSAEDKIRIVLEGLRGETCKIYSVQRPQVHTAMTHMTIG